MTFAVAERKLTHYRMVAKVRERQASASAAAWTTTPYDPLDLRTLAESMARVVLEQNVHPLAAVPVFEGAGVYVIYYTGDFEPYRSIAQKNRGAQMGTADLCGRSRPKRR